MNGRIYDFNVGRFLSVDPFLQFPDNSQSANPYSYILNNPMAGTDPTGYACAGSNLESVCDSYFKDNKIVTENMKLTDAISNTLNNGKATASNGQANELQMAQTGGAAKQEKKAVGLQQDAGKSGGSDINQNGIAQQVPCQMGCHGVDYSEHRQATEGELLPLTLVTVAVDLALPLPPIFTMMKSEKLVDAGEVGLEILRKGDVRVGRWMSPDELAKMKSTGVVQEGSGGMTFVANSGASSFKQQAKSGSYYVEFDVRQKSLLQGGKVDWFKTLGSSAPKSQQFMLKKQGGEINPPFRNLSNILDAK